ncbi:MAG: hypothetical protein KDA68_05810 [Planctomycetaceae bacterium]|nr:hypothetical protein [Planctomycetaceae bacterium]
MRIDHIAKKTSWSDRCLSPGAVELLKRRAMADLLNPGYHCGLAGLIFLEMIALFLTVHFLNRQLNEMFGLHLLRIWSVLGLIAIALMSFLTIGLPIGEEKEFGTLGLFKLSGIGPFGIFQYLFGYWVFQVFTLTVLQFPLLGFVLSFADVHWIQIFSVLVTQFATAFLVSTLAYYCAVVQENRVSAFGLFFGSSFLCMLSGLFLYVLDSIVLSLPLSDRLIAAALGWIQSAKDGLLYLIPFTRLTEILSSGASGTPPWTFVAFCLLGGFLLLLLTAGQFEESTNQVQPQQFEIKPLYGMTYIALKQETPPVRIASRKSERVWENPFVWREFHFKNGGWNRVLAVSAVMTLLFAGFTVNNLTTGSQYNPVPKPTDAGDALIYYSKVWLILWASGTAIAIPYLFSTSLSSEIRGKTLGSLFLIGRPAFEIVCDLGRGRLKLLWHSLVPIIAGLIGVLIAFFLPRSPAEVDLDSVIWSFPMLVFITGMVLVIAIYLGYYFTLLSIRYDLIQSDSSKMGVVVLSIGAAGVFFWKFLEFLSWVSLNASKEVVVTTGLGLLFTSCIATMPTIPGLKRSIVLAIHNRMADS